MMGIGLLKLRDDYDDDNGMAYLKNQSVALQLLRLRARNLLPQFRTLLPCSAPSISWSAALCGFSFRIPLNA